MKRKLFKNHAGIVSANTDLFRLPVRPNSITKGYSLKALIDTATIDCLAHNVSVVYPLFDTVGFRESARLGLQKLEFMQRAQYLSKILYEFLPNPYSRAVAILMDSLTPPLQKTEQNGLGVFFYLPHLFFIANYGLNPNLNGGKDPFDISMKAQYELTRRFSAEYSIRVFLINQQERTLKYLNDWTQDPCPHVRRLCSEGTRPRLPWAMRIPSFLKDPTPCLDLLEQLKDDPELYVRRSVANHIGDIAKDNKKIAFSICESWLAGATVERKWLIRHALRYHAKKKDPKAEKLRKQAD